VFILFCFVEFSYIFLVIVYCRITVIVLLYLVFSSWSNGYVAINYDRQDLQKIYKRLLHIPKCDTKRRH